MDGPTTPRTIPVVNTLWSTLEVMSREMNVPVEALVNQALFSWARLNGYLEPSAVEPMPVKLPAPRKVRLVHDGRKIDVDSARFLIGRDISCQLTVDSFTLSRQHAAIVTTAELIEVEDLGSSNGTWVNGERVTRHALAPGDYFRLGDVTLQIEID
jgi:hypothetical protein